MNLDQIKALIFDVHRTLVDDSGFPRERIWKLLREEGIEFDMGEYYRLYDETTRSIFNWAEINDFVRVRDLHRRRLKVFYERYHVKRDLEKDLEYLCTSMAESRIYPEVPEVLNILEERYKLALLSNADEDDPLIQILLKAGFRFDTIVTSEALRLYKPRKSVFLKVLAELQCTKNEALLVGDSQISDVLGGKKAGLKVVWLNRRGEKLNDSFPKPDYEITDLRGLLNILKI